MRTCVAQPSPGCFASQHVISLSPREAFTHTMIAEILLVDDNSVQGTTRRTILSRSGRVVVVASSATQALEMLEDSELFGSVTLIITDHWMPGLNGPQFVEKLREQLPKIPVLVLSGLPEAESE